MANYEKSKGSSIIFLNVQSILNKLDSIRVYIHRLQPSMLNLSWDLAPRGNPWLYGKDKRLLLSQERQEN